MFQSEAMQVQFARKATSTRHILVSDQNCNLAHRSVARENVRKFHAKTTGFLTKI